MLVNKNREFLKPWLAWVPAIQEEKNSLKFIQDSQQEREAGTNLALGIWKNQILVGSIGLHHIEAAHRKASIGYWLDQTATGQGIMTRSVAALIKYGFETLQLNRLEIRAAVNNTASRQVAKRLNFKYEGIMRQAEWVNEQFLDQAVYSLLKADWIESTK